MTAGRPALPPAALRIDLIGGWRCPLQLPRKAQALLAYLVWERQPLSREAARGLLWPENTRAQAVHSLRNLLLALRKGGAEDCLRAGRDQVELAAITSDVEQFRNWAIAPEHSPGPAQLGELLWHFPPLGDEFDDWLTQARRKFNEQAGTALCWRGRYCAVRGDHSGALAAAKEAIRIDPYDEEAHRLLIGSHIAGGRPNLAVRAYTELAQLLRRELNVAPEPATRELIEKRGFDFDRPEAEP